MKLRTKIEIVGGCVLVALLLLVGFEQYRKAIDNAKAETRAEADKDAAAKIDSSLKARDEQYQQQVKALQYRYEMLAKLTPSQIVQRVPIYIPEAKAPIQIVGPDTQPAKLGDAIVPQEDIKPIATAILDGEQCKLDRAKCQADLTDWTAKEKLQEDQTAQWKRAAKGGSVLKRAGKVVLYLGIGAAAGYAFAKR